jgi:hypothetical protein
MAPKKAAKGSIDTSLFKRLAPRMMRDLMRDFSPLADFKPLASSVMVVARAGASPKFRS